MNKFPINITDRLFEYIYKNRSVYKKSPVSEVDLKSKSLDELILMKESEQNFLSINIPVVIGILGIMLSIHGRVWTLCMWVFLIIFLVNIGVAHEEKKANIKIYNKVILQKLKKQKEEEKKYKQEIINYLKLINES